MKMSIKLHYLMAIFNFLKINNEFQALFELIIAEGKDPSPNQRFMIFRLKKRIERVI